MLELSADEPLREVSKLSREEQHFLWLLTKRTTQAVLWDPPRKSLKSGHQVGDERLVATLCLNLPDPQVHLQESPTGEEFSYLGYQYKQVSYPAQEEAVGCLRSFLEHCSKQKKLPRFVVLNELALSFEDRAVMCSEIEALARKFGVYIAAGSYHCPDELFNVAPIVSPRGQWGEVKKQNSATRQKEQIRTPDSRHITTYSTEYGNFVLWICLDIYDPALMLKFVNASYRFSPEEKQKEKPYQEIHMVLVPSFNGDKLKNVVECLRLLSKYSKTVVVCANAFSVGGAERLESIAYLVGRKLEPVLTFDPPDSNGLKCSGHVYGYRHDELLERQAADYLSAGTMSTQFAAILGAADHTLQEVPEDEEPY